MIDVDITLHVCYNLDETPTKEELLDLIKDMWEDAKGDILVGQVYYDYNSGSIV